MSKRSKIFMLTLGFIAATCMLFSISVAADDRTIKISFQTKGSDTPEGFLADDGEAYADRGNGYTYGWNHSNVGNARDYSLIESDPRLATLNQFGQGTWWEIEVPNGTYEVTVSIGDIRYPTEMKGKLLLLAEDEVLFENNNDSGRWSQVKPIEDVYATSTVEVEVNDGKLTLDPKDSAHKNIKINYVEITSLTGTIPSHADSDSGSSDQSNSN